MKLYTLKRQQLIRKSLHEVFSFFSKPENLELLTPRNLGFQILTPLPIIMKEGALIDYTIKIGGLPMRWTTMITTYEPPHRFIDLQLKGPYSYWHHTHTFTETNDGTRVDDEVHYVMPFGVIGKIAHTLLVERQLDAIFTMRSYIMERIFLEDTKSSLRGDSVSIKTREAI